MKVQSRRLDNDAILYWTLLILILISYILIIFVVIAAAFPLNNSRFDVIIRVLLNVLATVVLLLTFRRIFSWAQAGVRDLIYGQHESPYPALAQLNQQL